MSPTAEQLLAALSALSPEDRALPVLMEGCDCYGELVSIQVIDGNVYTLPQEGGASLRAAGWRLVGAAGGGSWSVPSRPRVDTHPLQEKWRWEAR